MREIKCRIWDKDLKQFVANPDYYFINTDGSAWYNIGADLYAHDELMDVSDTVEASEYTGLKDKNGREIYEGDVFNITKHGSNNFEVVYAILEEFRYEPVYACFALKRGADFIPFDEFAMQHGEIIGNKYENPELLEAHD